MHLTNPIVIAGSGPSGSTLALYLAQRDIPVVLFEKEAQLPVDLRASTFHPPSLEIIGELGFGIAEAMIEKGLIADRYQYRDRRTNDVATFDMSLLQEETNYPFRLQLEQYEYTRLAHQVLAKLPNADVQFGHEVVGFDQHDDSVMVKVNAAQGPLSVDADFLVGADGARSIVRKTANIDFGGFTYDERFLVISTDFPFETVFDDLSWVNYVSDPEEWCVILRTEKQWRILFPTREENDEELLSDSFIQQRLHRLYNKQGDYEIGHRTLYAVNQRVAQTYFQGRVVLAGDACHINNPLGGMGMNGGIHDAMNLAKKLEKAAKFGDDHLSLFEHYNRQRRDLAVRFVQEHTINNKKMMEAIDIETQDKRQHWLKQTSLDPLAAKAFLMERAMINCWRESESVA